jgi:DNA repair protein RadA/Sms
MLLAVLDRHAGVFVLDRDVFVNVVGGMRLSEPAADLAILLAVTSSHTGKALPSTTIAFGEVGLTGELRPVTGTDLRLTEAHRQGFRRAIVPAGMEKSAPGIDLVPVTTVQQAIDQAF